MSKIFQDFINNIEELEKENQRLRNDLVVKQKENNLLQRQWEEQNNLVEQYKLRWILSMPKDCRKDPLKKLRKKK